MTTFGDCYHDFSRLAKQSGFYFQLHRGKVNWAEIENLNINDITENRNFRLLEQNLINVLNCNLEDLKPSDKNFVKLFKLAQLGVDYLAYCEMYLDKCVVILQEQLISIQDECESLKNEKEKRIMGKSKRKNKSLSYQCEKCDKAFISDVYLKFHDKRRHSVPNTPKSVDTSVECADNYQRKSSTSTQTTFLSDSATITENDELTEKVNAENAVKIETLEQEIRDLKERLKKAENTLTEKNEFAKSSEYHSPFPSLSTVLLLLPSHQTQSESCHEARQGSSLSGSGVLQVDDSRSSQLTPDNEPPSQHRDVEQGTFDKKENVLEENAAEGGVEGFEKSKKKTKEDLDCDKENIDPGVQRPLPPPRRSKKGNLTREVTPDQTATPKKPEDVTSQPLIVKCTPVRKSLVRSNSVVLEEFGENISDINEELASNKSLNSSKDTLVENSSRSSFKTILKKNSPKFLMLGRSLRKSLVNLCDSVTSVGKDLKNDSVDEDVIGGLNDSLRELGVDPEWSGIPKKTMKQKLKALRHKRKFLAKQNPMYPIIRQKLKEKVFQKLKKSVESNRTSLLEQPSNESVSTEDTTGLGDKAAVQSCVMYDIESESSTSDSEVGENDAQNDAPVVTDRETVEDKPEFDLSVFQVRKENQNKAVMSRGEGELSETDTDDDILEKQLNCFLTNSKTKKSDEGVSIERENQSILRSGDGFQSKLQVNSKKKVWFENHSNNFEEALSVSSSEGDDLWTLKDNWEKVSGT